MLTSTNLKFKSAILPADKISPCISTPEYEEISKKRKNQECSIEVQAAKALVEVKYKAIYECAHEVACQASIQNAVVKATVAAILSAVTEYDSAKKYLELLQSKQ